MFENSRKIMAEYQGKLENAIVGRNQVALVHIEMQLLDLRLKKQEEMSGIKNREAEIDGDIKAIAQSHYSDIEEATNADGKKTYSNESKRSAELESRLGDDINYEKLTKELAVQQINKEEVGTDLEVIKHLIRMVEASMYNLR